MYCLAVVTHLNRPFGFDATTVIGKRPVTLQVRGKVPSVGRVVVLKYENRSHVFIGTLKQHEVQRARAAAHASSNSENLFLARSSGSRRSSSGRRSARRKTSRRPGSSLFGFW